MRNSGISNIIELLIEGIEKQVIYKKHLIKIKNVSGQEIPVMINTTIQKDANDNLIGIIGAFKLVEEIKQFEDSVVRAKNLASLGALSAGMAHEIRNPLTSIKGYAQFIKSELKGDDELVSDISVIINEVDRLNGIIDRFLTFARPNQLKIFPASINKVCNDIIKLIRNEIHENDIVLNESYEEIPLLNIDAEQMEQAILNIVLNSIQAMNAGGELSLSTIYDKKSDFVEITVSDTGMGIMPEDFDKIFEPFFTTKDKGTGLGLAISSRIIEDHKGFLEVSSKPGIGTEFIIKLPIKN
jgi:signal transduction histidine kinase